VIPDLCVDLRVTLPQPIREASADILAKCVGASASRYDIHAPDRASIPPGPVGIANDTHTGRRCFTRAMVPAYSTDHVSSDLSSDRKVDNRIEGPCMLSGACVGCLKHLLGRRVDGQVVPHVFAVHADILGEVNSCADNKMAAIIDEGTQVSLREANTTSHIEEPFAVILGVR